MNYNNYPGPEHQGNEKISSQGPIGQAPPYYSNPSGVGTMPGVSHQQYYSNPSGVGTMPGVSHQPPIELQPTPPGYVSYPSVTPYAQPQYQVQPNQPYYSTGQQVPPQNNVQQVTVITGNGQTGHGVVETFAGQMFFSCFVAWCCNLVFGAIGFTLAMAASDRAVSDSKSARKLGRASWAVSATGIVVTLAIIGIVIGVSFAGAKSTYNYGCSYRVSGICYNSRYCYVTYSTCYYNGGVYGTDLCCYYFY